MTDGDCTIGKMIPHNGNLPSEKREQHLPKYAAFGTR